MYLNPENTGSESNGITDFSATSGTVLRGKFNTKFFGRLYATIERHGPCRHPYRLHVAGSTGVDGKTFGETDPHQRLARILHEGDRETAEKP